MSEVRVSYIVTTHDRAAFLDGTLANVREFADPGDELIVMEGGSTGVTAGVVDRYRDISTLFQSEPDCGETLMQVIWCGEHLRRGRLGPIVSLAACCLGASRGGWPAGRLR